MPVPWGRLVAGVLFQTSGLHSPELEVSAQPSPGHSETHHEKLPVSIGMFVSYLLIPSGRLVWASRLSSGKDG